jgi:hypothetical protein
METDWLQVIVSVVWGVGIGTLLILNAERLARLQRSQAKSMRYPKRMRQRFTPGLVRTGGVGFIVIGLVGAAMGLFFADKM